jgi:hypothetical protein
MPWQAKFGFCVGLAIASLEFLIYEILHALGKL